MPWCPQCKAEYQEGYRICRGCQVDLIDELPDIAEAVPEDDCEAFLFTAADNMQADLMESLLRAYHIPVLRKYRGIGNYSQIYWGFTKLGVDLFVPSSLLTEARDILESATEKTEDVVDENEDLEIHKYYEQVRRMRNWVVFLYYISGLGLIVFLIYWLYKSYKRESAVRMDV
jgi:hypothetical protein